MMRKDLNQWMKLWSVLWVSFIALTLLVGWQEQHPTRKEYKPQTHRTVREISRETRIHRSSVSQIICKDLHLKCFKRRRAQQLSDANCAAPTKRAKLLLQKFPQSAIEFVFFMDENTLSMHSYMRRGMKIGALKMQFVCIFIHICWISAENLNF